MMRFLFILMFAFLLAGCTKPPVAERKQSSQSPPATQAVNSAITVADTRGILHTPLSDPSHKATVLLFIMPDCPIANSYAPQIQRITAAYEPRGIKVYLVHADPDVTAEKAAEHAKDYGYANTVLVDQDLTLAKATGAEVTPEAVVVSPGGDVLYRGRIDDRYADYGRKREVVTKTELQDALDAILAGRAVKVARAEAIGCHIPF